MGVNVVIILTLLPALALLPKARAGCSNSARPDPCGGPPARAVPTATNSNFGFARVASLGAPSAEFFLSVAEGLRTGLGRETHGGKLFLIAISETSVLR